MFSELNVPFPSAEEAKIAHGSLSVDREPKRGNVSRELHVKGNILQVRFKAIEVRTVRVSINSFLEHLKLVCETIEQFGPPR
ncbi:EKC/KEOPS complex subunit LAGE3 [Elysia marginata]|uniref:L antigen family member 3 n=1 Tax=Elysia marginata TaxID=1093978 RepID=A0AAV4GTZ6_9GAST|nr:EKC/KEOPS complex subunit LAGE3 [Elysia marginata]